MGKDINLYSQSWNDIIFENKNKDYGAYELRQTSGNRHLIAIVECLIIVAFVVGVTKLANRERTSTPSPVGGVYDPNEFSHLTEVETLNKIVEATEPPPLLKSTVQFIEPEIVSADEIRESETLKTQEELHNSKIQISTQTVTGTDEVYGVDIVDLKDHQQVADATEDEILIKVEQNPEFPGGNAALMKYLGENIVYPVVAQENNIKGRVTLKFVVDKDGAVSKIQILKGIDPLLDKEAIRVVQSMPKWIPGKQNGKNVNVWFTLPVTFQLN